MGGLDRKYWWLSRKDGKIHLCFSLHSTLVDAKDEGEIERMEVYYDKKKSTLSDRDLKVKFAVQGKDPIRVSVTCYSFHANDFSRVYGDCSEGETGRVCGYVNTV